MDDLSIRADVRLGKTDGGPDLALVDINQVGSPADRQRLNALLLALTTGWVVADPASTADRAFVVHTLASVVDQPSDHLGDLPPALVSYVAPELLRHERSFRIEASAVSNGELPTIGVTPSGFHGRRPTIAEEWYDPNASKMKRRRIRLTHEQDLAARTEKLPDLLYRWLVINTSDQEGIKHLNVIARSLARRVTSNRLTADNYVSICSALATKE